MGVFPCLMLIEYTAGGLASYYVFASVGGFVASVTGPNVKATLM